MAGGESLGEYLNSGGAAWWDCVAPIVLSQAQSALALSLCRIVRLSAPTTSRNTHSHPVCARVFMSFSSPHWSGCCSFLIAAVLSLFSLTTVQKGKLESGGTGGGRISLFYGDCGCNWDTCHRLCGAWIMPPVIYFNGETVGFASKWAPT